MKYIYGLLMIAWLAVQEIIGRRTDVPGIAALLGALCLFIVKEKYINRLWASIVYYVAAVALAQYWGPFILLSAIPVMDLAWSGRYALAGAAAVIAAGVGVAAGDSSVLLPLALAAAAGVALGRKDRGEREARAALDEERRLRHSLELAQSELVKSRREIESLTEARERNRIAHELHDSIGHGVAGVLIQLEAALRIHRRDPDRTEQILKTGAARLKETLELTRNAVYNLKPAVKTGVEALEEIVRGFTYCPVEFRHTGDFAAVSAGTMRILEATITEALTNTARHSHATAVEIRVDIRPRNVRLYIRDNGRGCRDIRENLGLGGMRDRVRNAGGTLAVDGADGFMIVCNLPEGRQDVEGGEPD